MGQNPDGAGPRPEPSGAERARVQLGGLMRDARSAIVGLVVGAVVSWLLGLPRPLLVVTVGFAAGLAAAQLRLPVRWQRVPVYWQRVVVGFLLYVLVAVAVTFLVPEGPGGGPRDIAIPRSDGTFDVVGEEDRYLDFDVPDGRPPTNVDTAADGSDVFVNLDGEGGLIRMRSAKGRIAPIGQDPPGNGACSATTRWTVQSIDVVASPYLCVETTEGVLMILHLQDVALAARPPRVSFSWATE